MPIIDRSDGQQRSIAAPRQGQGRGAVLTLAVLPLLAACQAIGLESSVGPTRHAIQRAPDRAGFAGLHIIDVTDATAMRSEGSGQDGQFATMFGDARPIGTTVGVGDVLEVTIWEAAPAALFASANLDTRVGSAVQASRSNTLPEVQVDPSGRITVPFAGAVPAAGRTLHQIERDIVARLAGLAHLPQAVVRIARNVTANVTVLGDVKQPMRVPLTPRGERLLDVIAQAGGSSQPLDRMTVQLTRGSLVQRMTAKDIVRDPRQNIVLRSDDVVTLLYQPYSFTVLGAAGKNDEVRFEGLGLTLSQALGRIGGLQEDRADPKGVFIFRWEQAADPAARPAPTIFRVDMKRPETYFAAQNFRMRDRDVMYIANSPLADIQRFVNIIASSLLPISTLNNAVKPGL